MAWGTICGDCDKQEHWATLTYTRKKVNRKKFAETVKERSEAQLTPNNAAMCSFIEMFTVDEEDDSDPINENDMEINPVQDDMQIGSNKKQIIEEADEEDIIETFTENIRYVIKSIPIVANLDLDKEEDWREFSDNEDESVDGNTVSALSINNK